MPPLTEHPCVLPWNTHNQTANVHPSRAIVDNETDGFLKVLVQKGSDQILGSTVIARNAGELIGEITLAMASKIGLSKIAKVIHPYPTRAKAIRKVADTYNRTRLKGAVAWLLRAWLKSGM